MKNTFRIACILFISVFVITSCESDDDNNAFVLNNANIAGTYNLTAFSGTARETDTSGGRTDTVLQTIVGGNFNNATVTFNANGTVSSTGSYTSVLTTVEDGFTDTETTIDSTDISGSYTITGNSIRISSLMDATTITILDFSRTGLKLNYVESDSDVDYTFDASVTFTLVRQ